MEISNNIRLSRSVIGQEEMDAVKDVLERQYLGMGEDVNLFEQELSDFFGSEAVCVNTGTTALHLALQAVGLKEGDEVLVQSLTYVATFQAISATGAKPIPCEIDMETCTLDVEDARARITKKTKAIVPVHYAGNPGRLQEIYRLAEEYNLRVIEDASHAFGTVYNNHKIGSFGDICCISLDGIKNLTSGEGGIIISKNQDVIDQVKDLRLLGVEKDTEKRYSGQRSWDFDVKVQAWRCHMSNIMAAIGRVQLKKFYGFKEKRQLIAKEYMSLLSKVENVELFKADYSDIVPHIFVIKITNGKRDILKIKLEKIGIPTGIHYKPNHLLSFYKSNEVMTKTETLYNQILTLPIHPMLSLEDVKSISCSVNIILNGNI
ncbi:MAG: DegT/DnrJ/EryC1/StrS family aminotransferase [Marinifilaceae bacterium]|jgi:dTDP-4-amino-4,6-dideoxygalactose transaminase|nr:DegT/DnrJ/EryC1/StrS family aminotransferase [Marinifilaceae bacterium]